jgi:hypothetical protein
MRESDDDGPWEWLSNEEWVRLPADLRAEAVSLDTTNKVCNAILTLLVKNHERLFQKAGLTAIFPGFFTGDPAFWNSP